MILLQEGGIGKVEKTLGLQSEINSILIIKRFSDVSSSDWLAGWRTRYTESTSGNYLFDFERKPIRVMYSLLNQVSSLYIG